MVEVHGEPVRVDEALAPLLGALEQVLTDSGAGPMRQTAAVLTLCRRRFAKYVAADIGDPPPEAEQLLGLIAWWLRMHRQIIAQENLRVRVEAQEFADERLPGEESS